MFDWGGKGRAVCVSVCVRVYVCVCGFCFGRGKGGTPHRHGHNESYKDLNFQILTSEPTSYLMNTSLTLYQLSYQEI